MSLKPLNLDDISARWDSALKQRDFRKGLLVALEGYKLATTSKSHVDERMFLHFIRMSVGEILEINTDQHGPEQSEGKCSFCCRLIEGKKTVQGPSSLICEDCIQIAFDEISAKASRNP